MKAALFDGLERAAQGRLKSPDRGRRLDAACSRLRRSRVRRPPDLLRAAGPRRAAGATLAPCRPRPAPSRRPGAPGRQRLAGPLVDARQRLVLRHREAQRRFGQRPRQHLQRQIEQHAERAERAGEQARDVVAGDVLHHRAAEAQDIGAAVEQRGAEHEVAHAAAGRSEGGAPRPGQASGDGAAEGRRVLGCIRRNRGLTPIFGVGAEVGRFEGEHLPALGEGGLEFGQRGAAAGGDHQFARLVADDAAIGARVEHFAGGAGIAVEGLAAAGADRQRRALGRRRAHALGQLLQGRIHRRRERRSDGCARRGGLRSAAARESAARRRAPACGRTRRSAPGSASPCRD